MKVNPGEFFQFMAREIWSLWRRMPGEAEGYDPQDVSFELTYHYTKIKGQAWIKSASISFDFYPKPNSLRYLIREGYGVTTA